MRPPQNFRQQHDFDGKPVADAQLYELLGLHSASVAGWFTAAPLKAAIAELRDDGSVNYVSRKNHPTAKRFEFARFMADQIFNRNTDSRNWLVTTDLYTSRQKFQRAFAAEFLCPIDALTEFVGTEISESSIENAASYFDVSEKVIENQLANNTPTNLLSPGFGMPYQLLA